MKIDLKTDIRSLDRDLRKIEPIVLKSTNRALNRTINHVRKESLKTIATAVKVPQKILKGKTRIKGSNWRKLEATLRMYFAPVKVTRLKVTQTKTGVSARGHKFKSAFLATMKSGHHGVFERVGKKRLPIREVRIPVNPPAETHIRYQILRSRLFFKRILEKDLKWRLRR